MDRTFWILYDRINKKHIKGPKKYLYLNEKAIKIVISHMIREKNWSVRDEEKAKENEKLMRERYIPREVKLVFVEKIN